MARPRTIKYEGGEVILKNLPAEVADRIKEMLVPKKEPTAGAATPEPDDAPMEDLALGVSQVGEEYATVRVKYNASTGVAVVDGMDKYKYEIDAIRQFKLLAVRNKIV